MSGENAMSQTLEAPQASNLFLKAGRAVRLACTMALLLVGFFQFLYVLPSSAQSLTARQILARSKCVTPKMLATIDKGGITAEENLAAYYENGWACFPRDARLAAYWYRKAAELGSASAQDTLASLYEDGKGVPRDYQQAAAWYRKAAEQGNANSQSNLANMYVNGEGFVQDYAQAAYWYRKAAEKGNENAEAQLGQLYDMGRGIPQNYEQAVYWYRKAAEQGNAGAQYSLGRLYSDGDAFQRDYIEAYFWFDLASASTQDEYWMKAASTMRDQAASHLAPSQLHDVQTRVATWAEAHPQKPCVRVDQQTTTCYSSRQEMDLVLGNHDSNKKPDQQ
jgi:TPR repeat protein